jgi:hypothetical protein
MEWSIKQQDIDFKEEPIQFNLRKPIKAENNPLIKPELIKEALPFSFLPRDAGQLNYQLQ